MAISAAFSRRRIQHTPGLDLQCCARDEWNAHGASAAVDALAPHACRSYVVTVLHWAHCVKVAVNGTSHSVTQSPTRRPLRFFFLHRFSVRQSETLCSLRAEAALCVESVLLRLCFLSKSKPVTAPQSLCCVVTGSRLQLNVTQMLDKSRLGPLIILCSGRMKSRMSRIYNS